MVLWTYRCYDEGTSPNLWRQWYDAHPEVQARTTQSSELLSNSLSGLIRTTQKLDNGIIEVRLRGSPNGECSATTAASACLW